MDKWRDLKIEDVKKYWEANPLCASTIPYPLGSKEFFEFYDKLREASESVEFSYALHEYKKFNGKKVLDVGCGNGYVLSKYALEGADVYGVDLTEKGRDLCYKRFALLGLKGDFRVGNAEQLPFEEGVFDCICSMGVLHHTPNPGEAMDEIYRILKRGGRLIIMVYHRNSALYRIGMPIKSIFIGKSLRQLVNEYDGVGNPKGDVYSRKELRQLMHKFDKVEMFVGFMNGRMIIPKLGMLIPRIILKPFERGFGWFLYAKAIKA